MSGNVARRRAAAGGGGGVNVLGACTPPWTILVRNYWHVISPRAPTG